MTQAELGAMIDPIKAIVFLASDYTTKKQKDSVNNIIAQYALSFYKLREGRGAKGSGWRVQFIMVEYISETEETTFRITLSNVEDRIRMNAERLEVMDSLA